MSNYEIYVLLLCIIVFVALTAFFAVMITSVAKLSLKLIVCGAEDEKIKTEYLKNAQKSKVWGIIDFTVSIVLSLLMLCIFGFSLYVNIQQNAYYENVPTLKVVNSGSMATKHNENEYLRENDINNQIQTFDIVFMYKIPNEEDLKLYDIVLYEVDGIMVLHRIVGIEEPNKTHSERYFLLQGDAVSSPDRFPVLYSQMVAIYRDVKIPFLGTLVSFMQSPAGWLCIILIFVGVISSPIIERKMQKEKNKRLVYMGVVGGESPYNALGEITCVCYDNGEQSEVDDSDCVKEVINQVELPREIANEVVLPINDKEEQMTTQNIFAGFAKGKTLTFEQKLEKAGATCKARYEKVLSALNAVKNVREIKGKQHYTYKYKSVPIAKLAIKGKTLNVYLGLNPADYVESKYVFTDVSNVKKFAAYPMRVKVTSDRQAKWVGELIAIIVKEKIK